MVSYTQLGRLGLSQTFGRGIDLTRSCWTLSVPQKSSIGDFYLVLSISARPIFPLHVSLHKMLRGATSVVFALREYCEQDWHFLKELLAVSVSNNLARISFLAFFQTGQKRPCFGV